MRNSFLLGLIILVTSMPAVYGQNDESSRNRTREQLGNLLEKAGGDINIAFRQSTKQPFNYVGMLTQGLINADRFEIVISVTLQKRLRECGPGQRSSRADATVTETK